jgi:hypothetical protein
MLVKQWQAITKIPMGGEKQSTVKIWMFYDIL